MIKLHLDTSALEGIESLKETVDQVTKESMAALAAATHAHIIEQVNAKLHSTRKKYLEHLSLKEDQDGVWIINLDSKALWIEEGMPPHSQVEDMLASPKAKSSKDGGRYLVVPFEHKKGPTQQTPAQKSLTDTIKREFESRKIPYGKLEIDKTGKPKTGLLHKFNIKNAPLKTANAPGQGKGPVGAPMQGPTGIPFLQGIRVYQREMKDSATGKMTVVKSIVTFRVVSSKHIGTDRWFHPGLEAKHFFEEALTWAEDQIAKQLMEKISVAINQSP